MKPERLPAYLIPFFLFSFLSLSMVAQPPEPEIGKRWILNEQFSDEFNGTSLDQSKWYDYNPKWIGRPPAIFLPSQVSVSDGLMRIRNKKLNGDTVVNGLTFTIGGGAVASRDLLYFGFYECSMKASKIRMSSTFWMSSKSFDGPDACNDRYSLEIDIQEAVGGHTNPDIKFRKSMNSNSHYKYTPCGGEKTNYSVGGETWLEEGEVSDTFVTYGAYWKNENEVDMYLNGRKAHSIRFNTAIHPKPFDRPMQMNMVTETYDWVRPLPTAEDLGDNSRNTTYYDWVRSYKLVDINYKEDAGGLLLNPGFESGDLSHWAGWGGNPLEVVSDHVHTGSYAVHIVGPGAPEYPIRLKPITEYKLSCYGKVAQGSGEIQFGVKDSEENYLGSVTVSETEYTHKEFSFTTASNTQIKFYFYAPGSGVEGWADDFELVEVNAAQAEPTLWEAFQEQLYFYRPSEVYLNTTQLDISLGYLANRDLELLIELYNPDSTLIGTQSHDLLAGYGVGAYSLKLDSVPGVGPYLIQAMLLHTDTSKTDTISLARQSILLVEPVQVELRILDARDDHAISDAAVTIGDSTKLSSGEGLVVFYEVAPGSSEILVEAEGYESLLLENLELRGDTLISVSLTPQSFNLVFDVYDSITGHPLSGATIRLGDEILTSIATGKAYASVYKGSYSVTAQLENYYSTSAIYEVWSDTVLPIALQRSKVSVKFVLKKDDSYLSDAFILLGEEGKTTSTIGIASFSGLKVDSCYNWSITYDTRLLLDSILCIKSDTTIRMEFFTTGLMPPATGPVIALYPNPAGDHIHVTGLTQATPYTILTGSGQQIQHGQLDPEAGIDISAVPPGTYIVTLGDRTKLFLIKTEK